MSLSKAAARLVLGAGLLAGCQVAPATGGTSVQPSVQATSGAARTATSKPSAGSTAGPSTVPSSSPTPTTQLAPLPICQDGTAANPADLTLTFAAEWDGDLELYSIQADVSGLTQLTTNALDDLDPAWSPDGSELAYLEGSPLEERLMLGNAAGQNARVLTPESLGPVAYPSWSPEGDKIAFRNLEDLYVVDVESGATLNLTQNTQPFPLEISFSMDGSMLAFNAQSDVGPSVQNKLFVINVDGSGLREFTIDEVDSVRRPTWDPTENVVLFEGSGPIEGDKLYLAAPDGTLDKVPRLAETGAVQPAWSPDGSLISYRAYPEGSLRLLVANESVDIVALELSAEVSADLAIWRYFWAPDSRHIAYSISVHGSTTDGVNLFVLDICTGATVPIAQDVYPYSFVSWRPNR